MHTLRRVLLAQLPIPPLGPGRIRGNVPLAGAYLKLFARQRGLENFYDIDVVPAHRASTLGDRALAVHLAARRPWLVGFTCYLWNIERTLWVARELKRLSPATRIVVGGPEITGDNAWVLDEPAIDFAVIGEGEQTFAALLLALLEDETPPAPIPGLYVSTRKELPAFRTPLPDLNMLGSPYLAGILDAAEEQMLLLETTRGCVFKCKFCYYPKSYDKQYYLAPEAIRASLSHARDKDVREVFLLDPTLNQRKDFAEFLGLLAEGNPGQRFHYFGELRGEGITEKTAALLRQANFTEVEVGLQSIDPEAMLRMDRKNNLRAIQRGVRAMMAEGIRVRVDMIVGLPGDTVESVRRGLHWLRDEGLGDDLQAFNLAVLPGTAFRHEASALGLKFQPRPPYYVLETPNLRREDLFALMREAQELFEIEFDAQSPPVLEFAPDPDVEFVWRLDLDRPSPAPPPERRSFAFTLWATADNFRPHRETLRSGVRALLADNPFSTLQVILEPRDPDPEVLPAQLDEAYLAAVLAACQESPSYLDRYYALQPGGLLGAKRLVVLLPLRLREHLPPAWLDALAEVATLAWSGTGTPEIEESLAGHEFICSRDGQRVLSPAT
jgi:hypothetical protein